MQKTNIFYGWYIVGISFTANFMATGTGFYIFNTFMQPLCEDRGWTRTEVSLAIALGGFVGLFGALFYGTLVTRIGPRILMTIGPVVSAISFTATGFVKTLPLFYLFYFLLVLGNGAMNGIVAGTMVNNWFIKKRGKAIGIATMGVSLSGVILPFVALLILEISDLEHAYTAIGVVILLVSPAAWAVARNWPEDHGLLPDGNREIPEFQAEGTYKKLSRSDIEGSFKKLSLSTLLRVNAFWKVGLAYGLITIGVSGVMSQLKPRFSDIGFDDRTAMLMMAATALMGTLGKIGWGVLCDRFEPKRVVAALMTATAVGLGFSLIKTSIASLVMFILIFGFSMGGVMSTMPILVATLFGRTAFPFVSKFLALFMVIQFLGITFMGVSFDYLGSYDPAYFIFIVLNLVAASLILTIKKPRTDLFSRSGE